MARTSAAEVITFPGQHDEPPRGPVPLDSLPPIKTPGHGWATLASLAMACGLAAVGLGAWIVFSEIRSEPAPPPRPVADSVAVLADTEAERYPLRGSLGRIVLVVSEDGQAVLTLDGLGPAPAGKAYAVWVVPPSSATPGLAGTFDGTNRVVPLERLIPPGARVAVTLETAPPPATPSRSLRLSATRE